MQLNPRHIPITDQLGMMHGKKKSEIYVVLSKDGSTVMKDPGMERPWSSHNKKIAEMHAKENGGYATDLITAMHAIMKHPKNQPSGTKGQVKNPFL